MKKYNITHCIIIPLAVFLLGSTNVLKAQITHRQSDFWNRVQYGGGLGIGFGNQAFNAHVSPSAIYRFSPYLASGIGLNFNYARFGDTRFTAYGGSILGLVNPVPPLQISAEFEELRVNRDFGFPVDDELENYWLPALFAGLGYSNGNITVGIRYDLLYDEEKSIYADPWMPFVRFYF